jgi:hypothetical protein
MTMTADDLSNARMLASEWHSGQMSALYAFSSSGHVDSSTELELERVERELEHRYNDPAYSARLSCDMDISAELERVRAALETVRAILAEMPDDTSEDLASDHGYDTCPDCGDAGIKMTADGYADCTRFLTCWSDPDA